MTKILFAAVALMLAGCAAAPEKLESVGRAESARLTPPEKRFSSYASYELRPMVLSEAVKKEEAKIKAAGDLETVLRAKLQPLFDRWQASTAEGRSGTLVIEPRLDSLRIVSGGARFFAGALVGESSIDLDLLIADKSSGQQIARARIVKSADAMTGAWSVGRSDQNLLDYIASIAYYYMTTNY
jgi:hypothetical protein